MKKILFYGDSNTYGFDPRGWGGRYDAEDRWPDIVADALRGRAAVSADGMNGREIPGPRAVYARSAVDKWIRREAPVDLFAVMLGSNDFINMQDPDPEAVAERMADFAANLLSEKENGLASANLLIIAPPVIDLEGDPIHSRYDTSDGRLSDALRRCAAKIGAHFLDACGWDLPMAFDRVHLSEEGHRKFAGKILEWLEQERLV